MTLLPRRLPGRTIRAAGGVLWRRGDAGAEVAVIHRPRYDDWSLPKGKLDPGEDELTAALREVEEETGHRCVPGPILGTVAYRSRGRPKTVRYWLLEAQGEGRFTPGAEVDALRWLEPAAAAALLTHAHDRDVLQRALRHLAGTVGA